MTDDMLSVLSITDVTLGCRAESMWDAIDFVGGRLVDRGSVAAEYVAGMQKRETLVSTFLGNGVALPHGVHESKEHIVKTGIVVAQYPDGVDWATGTAYLVVGLAAVGDDHVAVLSQLAEILQDDELCEQMRVSDDPEFVHAQLTAGSNDDLEDE
jgi:mannitol/fructose-specific phosphotransferase system IIA component